MFVSYARTLRDRITTEVELTEKLVDAGLTPRQATFLFVTVTQLGMSSVLHLHRQRQ